MKIISFFFSILNEFFFAFKFLKSMFLLIINPYTIFDCVSSNEFYSI